MRLSYDFLVHKNGDSVGVAVKDLKPGENARGRCLTENAEYLVKILDEIPLGHKIALKDIKENEIVIEYGEGIGIATKDVCKGEHVHVHNLRSARWGDQT